MQTPFLKMHGLGNDFVVIDRRARACALGPGEARRIADRHRGVGCDQIILLDRAAGADLFMRILNADGSEAGACGNATRCVAELLFRETGNPAPLIRTLAGDLPTRREADGRITVDMGRPALEWDQIPLARPLDTLHLPLALGPLADPAACSMGNPHATFFASAVDHLPIAELGPVLEHDPLFPERANIGFAEILAPDRLRLIVWERGAGRTLACGSGACAALVNAHRRGLVGRRAGLLLDGGEIEITWREDDDHVLMTGPAAIAFHGTIDLAAA
ncbi:MAG: diaminopimelate epimerase [Acidibrevibacterium sp.]|uniref:diaminopimelate epimerase n=1 Tax=Acidibrevibacterium sp. TaxID=2606776 RepID=UPI003D026218